MRRIKEYIAISAVIALIAIFSVLSVALVASQDDIRNPYPVKGYVILDGNPVSAGVNVTITDNTRAISLNTTTDDTGFYYREIYQAIPASQNSDSFTCSVSYSEETGRCSFNLNLSKSSQQCDIYLQDTTPPNAVAKPDYQTVLVNQIAQFNGSNSTDNIGIASYYWNFGDGENDTGMAVSHSYLADGIYTVTLTVSDAVGNEDSDTCEVSMIPGPTEQNNAYNVNDTLTTDNNRVTINGTDINGTDPLNDTVSIGLANGTLVINIDVNSTDNRTGKVTSVVLDTPEVTTNGSLNRSADIDLNLNSSVWNGNRNVGLTLQPLNSLNDTATWTESAGANATNAVKLAMSGLSGVDTAIIMHAELSGINETDVYSLPINMTVDGDWYRDVAGSKSANVYLFKFYDNGTKKDQKNPKSFYHNVTNDTYTFHFEMDGF
ncbi:MAG: PKD domain-containing protein [Methanosarcinales archaeon]|nr:MAG: PKD domain-containing protein [Methanosarcinales archaeon]